MASAAVKREPGTEEAEAAVGESGGGPPGPHGAAERRTIRSRYLALKNLIGDEKDDTGGGNSDKFRSIITQVDNLHELVQKPREQVADAEALLDITNSLLMLVKSQSNDTISPSDFVNALLRNFGQKDRDPNIGISCNMISWKDVGLAVSLSFRKVPECYTMIGPMDITLKQRRTVVHRKRMRPAEISRPDELSQTETQGKNDTDKNMLTMFNILRKKRRVRFENLVLNRLSFSQTVENIFALSFLVKDGRAEITVDDDGCHLVSPRNAPVAMPENSGGVTYHHFIFRFDFKDWKLMLDFVALGEELMPHRSSPGTWFTSQEERAPEDSQSNAPLMPIRKLTRNRGLVIQEESLSEDGLGKDLSAQTSPN